MFVPLIGHSRLVDFIPTPVPLTPNVYRPRSFTAAEMYDSPEVIEVVGSRELRNVNNPKTISIMSNLFQRELTGKALHRSNPFGEFKPASQRMSIEQIVPRGAIEAGNIFMGFTECGRYLLSYTVRSTETDFGRFLWSEEDLTFEYKLHFWLFTPNDLVRRVCSVPLFDNYGICHDNLLIEISQWKDDQNRLLVTGRSVNPALPHNSQQFVTITTIPNVKQCQDCKYGLPDEAHDDEFGGVALTRTTCIRHGLTIHLAHDQVQPFPRFNPDTMLRYKDSVVLNTGNLFHIFTIKLLEPKEASPFRHELLTLPPDILPNIGRSRCGKKRQRHLRCDSWFQNCHNSTISSMPLVMAESLRLFDTSHSRLTEDAQDENVRKVHALEALAALLPELRNMRSVPPTRERRLSQSSVDSTRSSSTTISHRSSSSRKSRDPERDSPGPTFPWSLITLERSKIPPDGRRKFFKRLGRSPSSSTLATATRVLTPKAAAILATYDTFEVETVVDRNMSSFRKRRLADKKYEFNDAADLDLSENIVPLKLCRKPSTTARSRSPVTIMMHETNGNPISSPGGGFPRSPRGVGCPSSNSSPSMSPAQGQGEILRSITNNSSCGPPLMSPPPSVLSSASEIQQSCTRKMTTCSSPSTKNSNPSFTTNINCIAKVLRCYAEDDDGALSVKTDTDDEYRQTLPFPVALQLKVHGTAYRPMNVISNSKSRTCPMPVVEVLQRSLDIEILCNEVSGLMCTVANKSYSSCFDYDVAIIDVCQNKGSITAIAFVLLTAVNQRRIQVERYTMPTYRDVSPIPGLLDQKQKYQAMFSFIWEPIEERARVLYMGNLKEIPTVPKRWHPTKLLVPHIRSRLYGTPSTESGPKTLRNDLAVKDWKSLDEITDSFGIVTLFREKRPKLGRVPGYFPSPALSSESSHGDGGSTGASDEDEVNNETDNEDDNWLY